MVGKSMDRKAFQRRREQELDDSRCACGVPCHLNAKAAAREAMRVGTENIRLREFLRQWVDLFGGSGQLSIETRALLGDVSHPPSGDGK